MIEDLLKTTIIITGILPKIGRLIKFSWIHAQADKNDEKLTTTSAFRRTHVFTFKRL